MNTPAQEHVCYDFLCSFEQGIREHPQKEADTSDQKSLEINIADKIEALLEDYPACDALIRFRSYLDAEVERYRSANDEKRKLIVENVAEALNKQIKGDNSLGAAMVAARNHDMKCRELAQKDWLNHVDFMALIGILDGVKSLKLDEARIEDKQYLVESFKGCLPSEKLILLNESPAFPCTPMELADWFKQIKLPLNKIIPSFVDELAAIEATKAEISPEFLQSNCEQNAENEHGAGMSIIRNINGREAIPVWSIPYVCHLGVSLSAGFGDFLRSLAHKPSGMIEPDFITAYLQDENGAVVPISINEWKGLLKDVNNEEVMRMETEGPLNVPYYSWRESSAIITPTQAFLYVDELSHWYYEAHKSYIDEDGNVWVIIDGKHEPIPYRHEDYPLILDPIIPKKVLKKHGEWFEACNFQGQGGASPEPEQATGGEASVQKGFDDLGSVPVRRERTLIKWLGIQEIDEGKSFDRWLIKKKRAVIWDALSKMNKDDFPPVSPDTIKKFFNANKKHCRFKRGRRPG